MGLNRLRSNLSLFSLRGLQSAKAFRASGYKQVLLGSALGGAIGAGGGYLMDRSGSDWDGAAIGGMVGVAAGALAVFGRGIFNNWPKARSSPVSRPSASAQASSAAASSAAAAAADVATEAASKNTVIEANSPVQTVVRALGRGSQRRALPPSGEPVTRALTGGTPRRALPSPVERVMRALTGGDQPRALLPSAEAGMRALPSGTPRRALPPPAKRLPAPSIPGTAPELGAMHPRFNPFSVYENPAMSQASMKPALLPPASKPSFFSRWLKYFAVTGPDGYRPFAGRGVGGF